MDYKERLRLAKEALESGSYDKDTIEYIFPELKESEDEKIRKEIILFVKGNIQDEESEQRKTYLTWLEKQSEPVEINPTEFDTRLQALIGKFDSLPKEELIGSLSFWMNVVQNDGTYKEEKQAEQKSVKSGLYMCTTEEANTLNIAAPKFCVGSIYEYDKNKGINIGGGWLGISDDTLLKYFCYAGDKGEQKSAWSEEDEEILDGIIVDVEVLKGQDRTKGGKAVYQEEIDWLKSLKDRVQPQPKQEWSEEDEKMLYEIIDFFKNGTVKLQHDLSLYANWLKSLRPQSQWKPSEEQMDALDFAVDCTIYPEFQEKRKALKELLAQLNRIKL